MSRGLIVFTLSILLIISVSIIYVLYIFSPMKSNVYYKIGDYKYRIINIKRLDGIAEYSIYCFLKNAKSLNNDKLLEFISLLNSKPILDTLYEMKYVNDLDWQVFEKSGKYILHFVYKNIAFETYSRSFVKMVFISREERKLCVNFNGHAHVLPDTCILLDF